MRAVYICQSAGVVAQSLMGIGLNMSRFHVLSGRNSKSRDIFDVTLRSLIEGRRAVI